MPSFPDRITITRYTADPGSGGSQDDDGVWTPGPTPNPSESVVLAEQCDLQDSSTKLSLSSLAEPTVQHDAVCYLKRASAPLRLVKEGDVARVQRLGGVETITARVSGLRRVDNAVLLKYVGTA